MPDYATEARRRDVGMICGTFAVSRRSDFVLLGARRHRRHSSRISPDAQEDLACNQTTHPFFTLNSSTLRHELREIRRPHNTWHYGSRYTLAASPTAAVAERVETSLAHPNTARTRENPARIEEFSPIASSITDRPVLPKRPKRDGSGPGRDGHSDRGYEVIGTVWGRVPIYGGERHIYLSRAATSVAAPCCSRLVQQGSQHSACEETS